MLHSTGVGKCTRLGRDWCSQLAIRRFSTPSPPKPVKAAKAPIIQPNNESKLHYKTKEHLANQLSRTKALSIRKTCSTVSNPEAPAVTPYWTCTNTTVEKDWLKGWDEVQMEHSKRGIGRFDLGLLRRSEASKEPALVGVIEVLVSSPMTDSKLVQLQTRNIPWVEVQASVDFFRDESKLLKPKQGATGPTLPPVRAWTHDQPLPVIGTSDGPWTCDVCKEMAQLKPDSISFTRISGIVDVYCSAPTFKGRGQLRRKVFGIYQQTRPKHWAEPHKEEETHWFFVVGTALSTTNWLGMDTLPIESKLLCSTHNMNPKPNTPPIDVFEQEMQKELERERRADAGALFDVRLDWPGSSIKEFFDQSDNMSSMVSIQGIKSIGKLHASLSRIVGFRYRFDPHNGRWIPSRNFRKPLTSNLKVTGPEH